MIRFIISIFMVVALTLASCSAGRAKPADSATAAPGEYSATAAAFSGDSAYLYVKRQLDFGPRVPNTAAHAAAASWLASELEKRGATVSVQQADLKAFDGTILKAKNIFAQFNPSSDERILLLAHWDCRPWADEDADVTKHTQPVDGANDGASGVGVLLEIARQLQVQAPAKGVDILLVDAEDWGTDGDEDSWALGAKHFAQNPVIKGYAPKEAILLDMVGGTGARFPKEYFSEMSAPGLNAGLWSIAREIGYGNYFINSVGSAVTDDHIPMIEAGIPTVDIIEFDREASGFNPRWHTSADNLDGISAETLQAVGATVMTYLRRRY